VVRLPPCARAKTLTTLPVQTALQTADVLLRVRGIVQGVGFRPFVHRIATALHLRGWVRNDAQGVLIRAVGNSDDVDMLVTRLREQAPPAAHLASVQLQAVAPELPPVGEDFRIVASDGGSLAVDAAIPPDLALCAECRAELLDPHNRRHGYPFINCTQCGPRFSIIEALPYDRPATTMRAFRMCPECAREYRDPLNRRFHAQPNACPTCGPAVTLVSASGRVLGRQDTAIRVAAQLIASGMIVAVKGVGGYHLLADATNDATVRELRRRKHRDEKPLAVMFRDLAAVGAAAEVSAAAHAQLTAAAAPIVLLPRRDDAVLAPAIAPGNPWIGALLAYAPVHVLLLQQLNRPVVATSANLAEEPLCTDPAEAHERLAGIADAFLDHDRPIAHPVDDSVVRLATAGPIVLRRARGHAPAPFALPASIGGNWLCVGGHMKNVVGVAAADRVVLSPHIGDLGGAASLGVFRRTIDMLAQVHRAEFTAVACDLHPDYASTRHAHAMGLPCVGVQHHLAHILSCLLEHGHAADDVLGIAFDGTGYGDDGTVWGGEFIRLSHGAAQRFARLRHFRLAGGDAAARDPRRAVLGLLQAADDPRFDAVAREFGLPAAEATILAKMLSRGLNAPLTSSAGRLFDAVGALLGLGRHNQFEGQTPLAVEAAAMHATHPTRFPLSVCSGARRAGVAYEVDWQPLLDVILQRRATESVANLAAGFHLALADAMVTVAQRAGVRTVALSGGCFQNALLLDCAVNALTAAGFTVLTHRALPPNDGGIAAGQALAALWNLTRVAPF
jgi:hydrogenase maturation protein HypF